MSEHDETPWTEAGDGRRAEESTDAGLEAALRAAMRVEQPPAGFAERVQARIAAGSVAGIEPAAPVVDAGQPVAAGAANKVLAMHGAGMRGRGGSPSQTQGGLHSSSRVSAHLLKAAVLLLAMTLPLGWRLHHQAEVARGEAAKEQVLLAFRITGSQLRSIQERTQSINAGGSAEGETQ